MIIINGSIHNISYSILNNNDDYMDARATEVKGERP